MPAPTTQSRQALRNRFVRHAIPTEKDFADLINASLNLADDGVVKLPDQPLGLVRQKQDQAVLRLYASPDADWTAWQMQLIGGIDKPGLGFSNQAGASALVLEGTSGHVGVGTTSPTARLTVCEANGSPAAANSGSLLIDHEDSGGASSIVFRSKVERGNDFAYIEYRDKNPALPNSQAGLLTIGIENETDDHLALMPSGNVGIATKTPAAKLHVGGSMRVDTDLTVLGALSASGNVGIGTTTPVQKLTVEGQWGDSVPKDSQSDLRRAGQIAIKSNVPQLDFIDPDSNQGDWAIQVNDGRMCFIRSPFEVTMILQPGGNVSIGADSNSHKLHVAGTMKVDSSLTVQGALSTSGNVGIGTSTAEQRLVVDGGDGWSSSKVSGSGLSHGGAIAIRSKGPQLDFIDTDNGMDWAIHIDNNVLYFMHDPFEDTLKLDARSNSVGIRGQLDVKGNIATEGSLTAKRNIATEGSLTAKGNITTGGDLTAAGGVTGSKYIAVNNADNTFGINVDAAGVYFRLASSRHKQYREIIWDGDNNWEFSSDETLKTDIEGVAGILQRLVQIDVKSYRWKGDEPTERKQVGFIAQQVQEVFPDLVKGGESGDDDGTNKLRLNYTGIGVLAVGAIKELQALFDQELAALRAELAELRLQRAPAHGDEAAAPASPTEVLP
ncbi:MAG: tail fiber domain-containing protein [Cyanobacteriota bacterium]|jgi:hypothetical protein